MNSRGAEKGVSDSRFTITLRGKVTYVNYKVCITETIYLVCGNNDAALGLIFDTLERIGEALELSTSRHTRSGRRLCLKSLSFSTRL